VPRKKGGAEDHGGGGGHDGGGSLRWLLTYADMITLLMAFFIMLYSMSILNLNKFRQVAISIKSGFGGLVAGQGRSVLGSTGQFGVNPSPIEGDTTGVPFRMVQQIERFVKEKELSKLVKLRVEERGLVVSLVTSEILFAAGRADLSPKARSILREIGRILLQAPNPIQVEGHTCDLPIASNTYRSNWELSTARATNVVRYLIEKVGLPPERLSAAGYADTKPLVPNTSEPNRSINRRVDIVILRTQ